MKLAWAWLFFPVIAAASDPCQLASRTVTRGTAVIQHSRVIQQDILQRDYGWRTCQVTMQAQHNGQTHTATGEYTWGSGVPDTEGCAMARERARIAIQEQIGAVQVENHQVLSCNDAAEPASGPPVWTKYAVGYIAPLHEFPVYNHGRRPFSHSRYPNSTCLQFLNHLNRIGGTICQTRDGLWVVVDTINPHQVK